MMKNRLKTALHGVGFDLRRYNPAYSPEAQIAGLLERLRVDMVFDIGANVGQYGGSLRALGYAGDIVSFEPLSSAHAALTDAAAKDPRWTVAPRVAVGAENAVIEINIAGNSVSSSVLDMLATHADAAPESRYTGKEAVDIACLDTLAGRYLRPDTRLFVKVDTQGFEAAVIAGAPVTLARTQAVQLELSLLPLYAGQADFETIIAQMRVAGFEMWTLWPGFADPATHRMLQIDALFVRGEPRH
jgi:FkbM family methyltransferase